MDRRPKDVDYCDPQWNWSSWKFAIPIDHLFGNLYDQFNTVPMPIQEPIAFHHDVSELCSTATTLDEFYTLLEQRRDQRLKELRQCWDAVSVRIAAWPPSLDEAPPDDTSAADRWAAFLHFSREFSFDALNRYFSLFTHSRPLSPLALPASSSRLPPQRSHETSPSTASSTSTAPIQTRKRKLSSSATSAGDDENFEGPRIWKKPRLSNKPRGKARARQISLDNRVGDDRVGDDRNGAAAESGSCDRVRRSSRIAARTQGLRKV